jgi:hypothetical protein
MKATAFIVALSEDKGFFLVKTFPKSVDQYKFLEFLKAIKSIYGRRPFCLYADNASIHKAKTIKAYLAEQKIEVMWSPVYQPIF